MPTKSNVTHEMATISERSLRNALKFGQSGEVDSKEGLDLSKGPHDVVTQLNCSEVGTPQVELNGAVGEAIVLQTPMQVLRTKLVFNIFFEDPFFD